MDLCVVLGKNEELLLNYGSRPQMFGVDTFANKPGCALDLLDSETAGLEDGEIGESKAMPCRVAVIHFYCLFYLQIIM